MIEGLKYSFTGAELKGHCLQRAKHHDERSKFYSDQAAALKDTTPPNVHHQPFANFTPGHSPADQLKSRGEHHRKLSEMFFFRANHFQSSEMYLLTEAEVSTLEMFGS